jgi:hypothetical protein
MFPVHGNFAEGAAASPANVPPGDRVLREDIVHSAMRVFAAMVIALDLLCIQAVVAQQPAAPQQPVAAQEQQPPSPPPFKPEELQQLLAPIALYPDDLIAQILTAATYPLEIVMAARWVADPKNAALKGDALVQALDQQSWDASVKSLVPFPSVLQMMSDKLDWTQKLGDAFLAQEPDCLAAVQTLRRKAQAAGILKSTPQQTVTVQPPTAAAPPSGAPATMAPISEEPTIAIQPADPQQVYVPYYDPATAYGAWPYPNYQPYAFPPPVGYGLAAGLATGLAFGAGVAITNSLWGWGRPNWGGGNVVINSNQFNRINLNRNVIAGNTWQHNAVHRQGVAYRDAATGQRYGRGTAGAAARQNYRGYAGQGAGAAGGRAGGAAGAAGGRVGGAAGAAGGRVGGAAGAAGGRVGGAAGAAGGRVGGAAGAAGGRAGGAAGAAGGRVGGAAGAAGGRAGGVAGAAAARPAAQNRPTAQNRVAAARPATQTGRGQAASRGAGGSFAAQRSAFNPGNGAQTRASAQRGAASRQQMAGRAQGGGFQRASGGGGGFHGGGGGARGGGGGARGGGGGRGRR